MNNTVIAEYKPTVLIDIDDTIIDLLPHWIAWLNKQHGLSVDYNEIKEWEVCNYFPTLTKEQVFEPLSLPYFWENVTPKDGAIEYIKRLVDEPDFNVYLCTSTDYRNVQPKFEKVIKRYFPFISWDSIIVTAKKQMIKADFLIDDCEFNLENGDYVGILFDAAHNHSYDNIPKGVYRVYSWSEVYDFLMVWSGKRQNMFI